MRFDPGANRLHRYGIERELAALHQEPADRNIGLAILPVIAQAHRRAVSQGDAAGALHLHEKCIHGIVYPEELQMHGVKRTALDLGAARIGHEAAIDDTAADALP